MRLRDLDPKWLKHSDNKTWRAVRSRSKADGIRFACPQCFKDNNYKLEGVHSVICWEPTVPPELAPGPGRWNMEGDRFGDLTLQGRSDSVLLMGGCRAHFFVRHGVIFGCD